MTEVRIPGAPIQSEATDIADPLRVLLVDLGLLESSTDLEKGVSLTGGTPASLQVIKAGALSVTKAWTALTASAGFAGASATLIAAWKAASDNLQIALIGGASLILAATAIAIALIVRGDVGARAATTVELYRSRAQISNSFLAAVLAATTTSTTTEGQSPAEPHDTLADVLASFRIEVPGQDSSPGLYGVRRRRGHNDPQIRRGDGDWVDVSRDVGFEIQLPIPPTTG